MFDVPCARPQRFGYCSPRNEKEQALAEQLHFSDRVRLACQTTIEGNVTMRRLILDAKDAGLTDQRKETTTHGSVGEERQIAILFVDMRIQRVLRNRFLPSM